MISQIQEILALPLDKLETLSDKELETLLGDLVPKSREVNKTKGDDVLKQALEQLGKLINI